MTLFICIWIHNPEKDIIAVARIILLLGFILIMLKLFNALVSSRKLLKIILNVWLEVWILIKLKKTIVPKINVKVANDLEMAFIIALANDMWLIWIVELIEWLFFWRKNPSIKLAI